MNNNKTGRFNATCYYFGKRGHIKSEYSKWNKRLEEMRSESENIHQENENSDVVFTSYKEGELINREVLEDQDKNKRMSTTKIKFIPLIRPKIKPK